MSNHIDRPYMIQWYGANGLAPRAALIRMAAAVGPAGRLRTRPGAGVLAQCLQCLAHGAETLGADVVDRRTGTLGRPSAGVREVGGVDELVDVVAGPSTGTDAPSAIQSKRIPKIPSRP